MGGLMTTIIGTLNVDEAVTLDSTLGVTGAATLSSTLDVTGDTSVSTLDSTGATSLATGGGVVNIASSGKMTTIKGTLNVDEAVTLDTTLGVTGSLSANGGIACDTNAFTVADNTGNTAIGGTLTVTGATSLNGDVSIGNAGTDKVGFYGATAITRPVLAKLGTADATSSISTFDKPNVQTAINNAVDTAYDAIQAKLDALIQDLVDLGLLSLS